VNAQRILEKLRAICLALPGTTETESWGHPNFRAGRRMYAAFDEYDGQQTICFIAPPPIVDRLDGEPRFKRARHRDWVVRDLESIDWRELKSLLMQAHAMATEPRSKSRARPAKKRKAPRR
jgi:predicted DNA-binding protein (MmcQ/YjbR family)